MQQSFALPLHRVAIKTDKKTEQGHARINGGTLLLEDRLIENVAFNTLGANVRYQGHNQIDGKMLVGIRRKLLATSGRPT